MATIDGAVGRNIDIRDVIVKRDASACESIQVVPRLLLNFVGSIFVSEFDLVFSCCLLNTRCQV